MCYRAQVFNLGSFGYAFRRSGNPLEIHAIFFLGRGGITQIITFSQGDLQQALYGKSMKILFLTFRERGEGLGPG